MQSNLHQRFSSQINSGLLKTILVVMAIMVSLSVSYAEDRVVGHWEGQIDIPGQPITVKVDLAINDSDWRGTIDIPTQGAKGLPLSDIHVVEEDDVRASNSQFAAYRGIRPSMGNYKTVPSVAHSAKVVPHSDSDSPVRSSRVPQDRKNRNRRSPIKSKRSYFKTGLSTLLAL